jgi:hypothetical protein
MRYSSAFFGPTVLLLSTLVACSEKDGDSGASDGAAVSGEDAATADALWSEISGYDSWEQLAPWTGIQPSTDVHGDYVQIWANTTAAATVQAAAGGDMPDGAITVKEGYSDEAGTSITAITVMKKISGYDSANGDWFYARYTADGTLTAAGESAAGSCAGCHAAGQDSVRAWEW